MRTLVAALTAAVTLIACTQADPRPAPAPAPAPARPDPDDLGDGTALGAPVRYRNLTLVPIVAKASDVDDVDYLVLDEGMQAGTVTIKEEASASVNQLTLTNRSERPLFVMAGEVVVGGKQDRIIGKNTVVPARTTQEVPVFCVEHGRWTGRHADFASAGVLAHQRLRSKAAYAQQGDVWDEVAKKNVARGKDRGNDTGTYRGTAIEQTTSLADWDAAFDRALAAAPARGRTVGYAVALGGQVVAVDVFGGPRLLARLDRKLRRSYYAEALDSSAPTEAAAPTAADVKAFYHRADAAPEQQVYDTPEADTHNQVGDHTASTTVRSKKKPAPGKTAKPIYKSVTKYDLTDR
jgi:ARG and Rhodanese-Phosphatase-superfamily-associated Protein domain